MTIALALVAFGWISTSAFAQTDQVVTPPPNMVLSNYNSVPVGPFGGLTSASNGVVNVSAGGHVRLMSMTGFIYSLAYQF
jgi:hypothetical protein